MDKVAELQEESLKKLKTADHILTQSYPLVKDSRLLLAVVDNLFLSLTNSMSALLNHERLAKKVPVFRDNFDSKFHMFTTKVAESHKINKSHIDLLQEIKDTVIEHRRSPVEFTRKESLIICSDNYEIKALSAEKIAGYLSQSKKFVSLMSKLIKENPLPEEHSI